MEIKEISKISVWGNNSYTIILKDEKGDTMSLFFGDGETEDNTLGRNFNDIYSIIDALNMAYEAGKNGEEWEIDDSN